MRMTPFWGWRMGQMCRGCLQGSLYVLQTSFLVPPSWMQDGGAGNDVKQDPRRPFRPPLTLRWKMVALPLPAALLVDLICGTGNEVIQDGGRKRKGRHLPPPPQWGSKRPRYTTAWNQEWHTCIHVICLVINAIWLAEEPCGILSSSTPI